MPLTQIISKIQTNCRHSDEYFSFISHRWVCHKKYIYLSFWDWVGNTFPFYYIYSNAPPNDFILNLALYFSVIKKEKKKLGESIIVIIMIIKMRLWHEFLLFIILWAFFLLFFSSLTFILDDFFFEKKSKKKKTLFILFLNLCDFYSTFLTPS